MQLSIEEKYNNFMVNVNFDNFLDFYYSHNDAEVVNEFNLTWGVFRKVKKDYNLHKTREQIIDITKSTWAKKPTSFANKHERLKKEISKEDLYSYYILNNNRFEDTCSHFNINVEGLLYLIEEYDLHKDGKLANELAKQTSLEKYGNANYNNREKSKQTCLEKYGVDNPFKDTKKVQDGVEKKYGVRFACQNEDIKNKFLNTMTEKYGGLGFGSDIISERIKQTNIERYGVENAVKSEVTKKKISKSLEDTFMKKCGSNCYFTSPDRKLNYHTVNSSYNIKFAELLRDNNIDYEQEFTIVRYSYDFKIGDNLIEINPFATHNSTWSPFGESNIKEKNYHLSKTLTAKENGYRCIHIWDWDNVDKVISLLKNRETIYGRKCEVKDLEGTIYVSKGKKEIKDFLNTYHLQGYAKSEIEIGLFYNDELVSIMTFGKPRYNKNYQYELIRYCSKYDVIGGAEKLFKFFLKKYGPKSIISYCDNSKFDGNTYIKLGFELRDFGVPSKHWYEPFTEKHITDNLLRQRGFDQLFGTSYGKGTSNEELMLEHGFVEIYDCGQSSYIYKNNL